MEALFSTYGGSFIDDGAAYSGIPAIRRPLDRAIKATADAAVAFYTALAGSEGYDEDAHNFFRVENLDKEFRKFLRRSDSKHRRERIKSAISALEKGLAGQNR
jgi:hypothetical protein